MGTMLKKDDVNGLLSCGIYSNPAAARLTLQRLGRWSLPRSLDVVEATHAWRILNSFVKKCYLTRHCYPSKLTRSNRIVIFHRISFRFYHRKFFVTKFFHRKRRFFLSSETATAITCAAVERLASLGIMGARISNIWNPSNITTPRYRGI